MRFFSSKWMCLTSLSCALFFSSLTAAHANTPQKSVSPLDLRPVVEWSKLSPEELQVWFNSEKQETVLEIQAGSMFSLKMEIEGEFFALRGENPEESPTLRLYTKKKLLITKRGSKYLVKSDGPMWISLEKALNNVVEKASEVDGEVEWSQDEYGPVIRFHYVL